LTIAFTDAFTDGYIRSVFQTFTDRFTDRLNPSAFDTITDEFIDGYIRSVFQTLTDNFTDGIYPSVNHDITDGWKSVGIFQAGNFFFGAQIPFVKPLANGFFVFPTDIATEWEITDEGKADGRNPSVKTSVNKSPTNS